MRLISSASRTAAVPASLASGALLTLVGRRRALVAFGLLEVAAIMTLFPLAQGQSGTLAGLAAVALLNIAYASAGTTVSTINMDWSRTGSAGSDFTVQDSLVHLCSLLAGAAGLGLAGILGYPRTLGLSVALGLAGVAAAAWLLHHPSTRRRGSKHPSSRHEPPATSTSSIATLDSRPAPTSAK